MLYEKIIEQGNIIGGASVPLFRKACLEHIGGFDNSMSVAEDLDLYLRLAQLYEFTFIDEPVIKYYIHQGEQLTLDSDNAIAGVLRLIEKNKDYLDPHKSAKWKRQMPLVKFYLRSGKRKDAFVIWAKTAFICPKCILANSTELARILLNWEKRQ